MVGVYGSFSKRGYPRDPREYIGIIEGLWGLYRGLYRDNIEKYLQSSCVSCMSRGNCNADQGSSRLLSIASFKSSRTRGMEGHCYGERGAVAPILVEGAV